MKKLATMIAALALAAPSLAQDEAPAPTPNQIVEGAAPEEWIAIPAEDLLVMTLAPDIEGNPREVVIQLMPEPFSQGWVENIRKLARAEWYDGISVNRVQDNYVVQWGDPNYDNPEADGAAKPLPQGLKVMGEDEYTIPATHSFFSRFYSRLETRMDRAWSDSQEAKTAADETGGFKVLRLSNSLAGQGVYLDPYIGMATFFGGWPLATGYTHVLPVHCYGMVGVGRNYSPDTGSGAELYTVIGHAPRHLDRNIALVGRIIEGMEHLSSLPRGKGELGFYAEFEKEKRTPILSIRVASDVPEFPQPTFEYLSTESESFAKYAEARANRRDPFFIEPAGGADICNIPVPVRRLVTD